MATINIAIDADSIAYKACYRHQTEDGCDIELAYFEFCQEIGKIRSAPFTGNEPLFVYEKGDSVDIVICFSPKKTFRNEIYPEYKANRKTSNIVGVTELTKLVATRLKQWIMIVKNQEADDIVNYLARTKNYLVAAIDKDVINANPTHTYNYNTFKWNQPNSQWKIDQWYLYQTLLGDNTDNIKGAKGIGKVKAQEIIDNGADCLDDIEPYFKNRTDLMINHWLVRMDQFNGIKEVLYDEEN